MSEEDNWNASLVLQRNYVVLDLICICFWSNDKSSVLFLVSEFQQRQLNKQKYTYTAHFPVIL